MATIVKMPKLGLTMTEGTIIKWIKSEGEPIKKGEPLVEIQTDKSNVEQEAPASGIVRKVLVPEGATVPVTSEIAIIGTPDEVLPETDKQEEKPSPSKIGSETRSVIVNGNRELTMSKGIIKASPAAKRLARENEVDLSNIIPTGPSGRIVEKDVFNYLEKQKVKATPVAKKIAEEQGLDLRLIQKSPGERITKQELMPEQEAEESELPMAEINTIPVTGMRKIIAERMTKSKTTVPHIYLTLDVDMTKIIELRQKMLFPIQNRYSAKLTYNDILIKAAAVMLKEYPIINSSFDETQIIIKREINIGFAVALDNGLIVPVIKDADKKGLGTIAQETEKLTERAKQGKLMPDDYSGGTFTTTNLGMYDIESFKAIINQPESAILAVGKIIKKPVVIDEQITIRPMMNLTLSCDHRSIDGVEGAKFLKGLKQVLEDPFEMLL